MKPPLVSILMSNRNENQKYLRDAVESICRQTYANWEFLIMDDGSESLENFKWLNKQAEQDSRIKVFRCKGVGLAAALNLLIKQARGEFFARMDSDDKSYPERIAKEIEYLITAPDTVLVGTWIRIINDLGETIHFSCKPDPVKYPWIRPAHSSWCGRMDVLRKIGGYSDFFPVSQDYDCWLRFHDYGRIGVVEEILLDYRWGRVSSQKPQEQIKYFWIANQLDKQRKKGRKTDIGIPKSKLKKYSFWYDRQFKGWAVAQKGIRFWQEGYGQKAFRQYCKAFIIFPFALEHWTHLVLTLIFKRYPTKLRQIVQLKLLCRKKIAINADRTRKAVCLSKNFNSLKKCKLSFIVPTINREQSLRNLLKTISREKELVSQVILVDAGNLDEDKISSDFPDLKIDYIRCVSASLTKQRNIGLRTLDSDINLVGFLDDDIIFEKDAIKNMIDFWRNNGDGLGGVACNIINVPKGKTSVFKRLFLTGNAQQGRVLRSGYASMLSPVTYDIFTDWVFGGATVWKKKVFDEFKFDEWFDGYGYGEDLDFSYRVAKKYKLAVITGSKVQHIKELISNRNSFYFGKMQIINRYYFVSKHVELSNVLCTWASIGQMVENLYMGILRNEKEAVYRFLGNCIGFKDLLLKGEK